MIGSNIALAVAADYKDSKIAAYFDCRAVAFVVIMIDIKAELMNHSQHCYWC